MDTPLPAERADAGIRVLSVTEAQAMRQELARVGCAETGVQLLTPKSLFRVMRLEAVPTPAANILKQEMLAAGGDAALHFGAIESNLENSNVLLLGTLAQLTSVAAHLSAYFDGLPATGEAILAALQHVSTPPAALRCGPYTLPLGRKTYVMGILNLTTDSFSGDGVGGDLAAALTRAEHLLEDGADLLDVGGESTRPGAQAVTQEEELRRVVPVVQALAARFRVPISVDTYKSAVARAALSAGATLINDISGLHFDPEMAAVAAAAHVPVVVMHIQGTPRTMQQHPQYDDLLTEVCAYLQEATTIAQLAGLPREQVSRVLGFGFGNTRTEFGTAPALTRTHFLWAAAVDRHIAQGHARDGAGRPATGRATGRHGSHGGHRHRQWGGHYSSS